MKITGRLQIDGIEYTLTGDLESLNTELGAGVAVCKMRLVPPPLRRPEPEQPRKRHLAASSYLSRVELVPSIKPDSTAQTVLQPLALPRIDSWPLQYVGAFRVPRGYHGIGSFDRARLMCQAGESMYVVGKDSAIAEVYIPHEFSMSNNMSELPIAEVSQGFADVWRRVPAKYDEPRYRWHRQGVRPGGIEYTGSRLIVSIHDYYDGAGRWYPSHFVVEGQDLRASEVSGCYTVGDRSVGNKYAAGSGFTGGSMCSVPSPWSDVFNCTHLTGLAGCPIAFRSSNGPCAFGFRASDLLKYDEGGWANPVSAMNLLSYPLKSPLLRETFAAGCHSPVWYRGTRQRGLAILPNSRTLLVTAHGGTGPLCYGTGRQCDDPTNANKGYHSRGGTYSNRILAYDLSDLDSVRRRDREPSDILPYRVWDFELPNQLARTQVCSSFDPDKGRLYVMQHSVERLRYARFPVIRVFNVRGGEDV